MSECGSGSRSESESESGSESESADRKDLRRQAAVS